MLYIYLAHDTLINYLPKKSDYICNGKILFLIERNTSGNIMKLNTKIVPGNAVVAASQ